MGKSAMILVAFLALTTIYCCLANLPSVPTQIVEEWTGNLALEERQGTLNI